MPDLSPLPQPSPDERPRLHVTGSLPPKRPACQQRPRRLITIISAAAVALVSVLIGAMLAACTGHAITGQPETPTATLHAAPTAPFPASTPTATSTNTASAPPCASHSAPPGVSGTSGATVTPVPTARWTSYTNTTYHYTLQYPGNWGADNITCPDAGSVMFWNYDDSTWNGPGFPPGGVKIELDAQDNPNHQSALDFWQTEQQNDQQGVGGPACPSFTTQELQLAGRDAVQGGCPSQNYVVFYVPDGNTMLRISQVGPPNEPTSDVLQSIINSLTFTS